MFASEAVAYSSRAPLKIKLLALHTNTIIARPAKDKYSSFLRKWVNYDHKKFYQIGPCLYCVGDIL